MVKTPLLAHTVVIARIMRLRLRFQLQRSSSVAVYTAKEYLRPDAIALSCSIIIMQTAVNDNSVAELVAGNLTMLIWLCFYVCSTSSKSMSVCVGKCVQ